MSPADAMIEIPRKPPTLTPPLKWHGGKQYLADRIVAMMPPHVHYVEPFFGGGAVLLARDPDGVSEVVSDAHGWLTNFWNVLRDPDLFPRFQRIVEATPFSEALFLAAQANVNSSPRPRDGDPVTAAVDFFVCCRQSMAGRLKSFAPLSRTRTRRRMNEQASAWLTAVEGLPAVHKRLMRVVILNGDAVDVIRQQDGAATLFYLDPPYVAETRISPDVYAHEMDFAQHERLLDVITRECSGKFMVSGYDSDLYRQKLAGWTRHSFDLPNNAAGGASKQRMEEVVWCNF